MKKIFFAFLILTTSVFAKEKQAEESRSIASNLPSAQAIIVGGQAVVYKFVDKVEGKDVTCYFVDTQYTSGRVAGGIYCLK
jgi:hypothetical protein